MSTSFSIFLTPLIPITVLQKHFESTLSVKLQAHVTYAGNHLGDVSIGPQERV